MRQPRVPAGGQGRPDSYRTSPKTTINWNIEIGATDDATDVRTTLRIPLAFNLF